MIADQITNGKQVNRSVYNEKNNMINNKIKSVLSQLPGKLRSINYKYNSNNSVTKAEVTVVVSSKEEALKVKQNSNDDIEINVIIIENQKNDFDNNKAVSNNQEKAFYKANEKKEEDIFLDNNTYTYNRGPDGKIYALIASKKKNNSLNDVNPKRNSAINDKLRNQYINIYKRYNFKNIKTKENDFSIGV